MATTNVIKYEIFRNRLSNILEEGRIAITQVSGSPVVVEGGETLVSFYNPQGEAILTGSGILLHCTGAADFVKKTIEWYSASPGIYEGDQFLWNDPYIGGIHTQDNIIVKPIFYKDELVAWVGSFMHTPETGAIDPGGTSPRATEIFHEGYRVCGLKIIEKGIFRTEIFNTITRMVRDPDLVGLDTKAKIAANNVCSRRFLELIEKYGLEFINWASAKLMSDAEYLSRERLKKLPDGIWRSQSLGDSNGLRQKEFVIACAMTKRDDTLTFDFTGSSLQNEGCVNCALPAAWANIFAATTSQLFWGIPWNSGTIRPIKLVAPAGSVVNCNFPAAVSNAAMTSGAMVSQVAHECIAKMLFAGPEEFLPDVTASSSGGCSHPLWSGTNQYGRPFIATVLDCFSSGTGASALRDGVDTGGPMVSPTSCISDVEIFESSFPILYLFRRQAADSMGFGKYCGGLTGEAAYVAYCTPKISVGAYGIGVQSSVFYGMFGGYPPPPSRNLLLKNSSLREKMAKGKMPVTWEELAALGGDQVELPANQMPVPIEEFDVVINRWNAGGGYGDPLDRDPVSVLRDVFNLKISRKTMESIFGVALSGNELDQAATSRKRAEIKKRRLQEASPGQYFSPEFSAGSIVASKKIHEYLEERIYSSGHTSVCCRVCQTAIAPAGANYKEYCAGKKINPAGYLPLRPPQGELGCMQEYYCPSCGTLLEADYVLPDESQHLRDIELFRD